MPQNKTRPKPYRFRRGAEQTGSGTKAGREVFGARCRRYRRAEKKDRGKTPDEVAGTAGLNRDRPARVPAGRGKKQAVRGKPGSPGKSGNGGKAEGGRRGIRTSLRQGGRSGPSGLTRARFWFWGTGPFSAGLVLGQCPRLTKPFPPCRHTRVNRTALSDEGMEPCAPPGPAPLCGREGAKPPAPHAGQSPPPPIHHSFESLV
jgi:hypothetical protein